MSFFLISVFSFLWLFSGIILLLGRIFSFFNFVSRDLSLSFMSFMVLMVIVMSVSNFSEFLADLSK